MKENSFLLFYYTCMWPLASEIPLVLFNTVSCYKCFGYWVIALSTCVVACFVEQSIDSLPVFNLESCSLTFDFLSVESLEEKGGFLGVSCTFNELLTVPWFNFL